MGIYRMVVKREVEAVIFVEIDENKIDPASLKGANHIQSIKFAIDEQSPDWSSPDEDPYSTSVEEVEKLEEVDDYDYACTDINESIMDLSNRLGESLKMAGWSEEKIAEAMKSLGVKDNI